VRAAGRPCVGWLTAPFFFPRHLQISTDVHLAPARQQAVFVPGFQGCGVGSSSAGGSHVMRLGKLQCFHPSPAQAGSSAGLDRERLTTQLGSSRAGRPVVTSRQIESSCLLQSIVHGNSSTTKLCVQISLCIGRLRAIYPRTSPLPPPPRSSLFDRTCSLLDAICSSRNLQVRRHELVSRIQFDRNFWQCTYISLPSWN